jgi:prepilin-type N-terminal cleavage/methylation domain-containing protein
VHKLAGGYACWGAFTLIELLVVISVISLLMSILAPALSKARRQAQAIVGMGNQRQIVNAVNLFAMDHDGLYPESVATIGTEPWWNWQEPTVLIGYRARSPRMHRSMSAYLRAYLEDADSVHCPAAPRRHTYIKEAWAAGDDWDNPETDPVLDPLKGTYCFYWNYTGYLEGREHFFEGPRGPAGGLAQSGLLVSCYFGYDHHRSPRAYGSCQYFHRADITEGRPLSSAYWSRDTGGRSPMPDVRLYAGYTDGRVESYPSSETSIMRVIMNPDTGEPYPYGIGPGEFYLPRNALP